MARIIPFLRDEHREAQMLLPWYAKGALDDDDRGRVEAHLASCAACTRELEVEQSLAEAMAGLPLEADQGWARVRRRLDRRIAPPRPRMRRSLAWAAMAAALCAGVGLSIAGYRSLEAPAYRTLSAPAPAATPALVVIFRPDAAEADLRRVLARADARIVDGPTAAGGYVLRTQQPPAEALETLRRQPEVVLAQPLDAAEIAR
jgi:hypothetical protein